jgi:heat shock protein HslJ
MQGRIAILKRTAALTATLHALALAGCATTNENGAVRPQLAQTDWVLIGYQQPGDGTNLTEVRLYDYTMHLDGDGTAQFKLACNRGTSRWRATRMENGNGRISIDGVTATTALCADGGIGERLAAELQRASAYSIYDGRLTLKATADSLGYIWDSID